MYPNRIGYAVFGDLSIECLEIYNEGWLHSFEFWIEGEYFSHPQLCQWLESNHPEIAHLITVLGFMEFLEAVLSWDPSDQTRDSFYRYLAEVANRENSWGD